MSESGVSGPGREMTIPHIGARSGDRDSLCHLGDAKCLKHPRWNGVICKTPELLWQKYDHYSNMHVLPHNYSPWNNLKSKYNTAPLNRKAASPATAHKTKMRQHHSKEGTILISR